MKFISVIFFAFAASLTMEENLRAAPDLDTEVDVPEGRSLTSGSKCYFYEIGRSGSGSPLYKSRTYKYELPAWDKYHSHKGYTIGCNFGREEIAYIKFYYPEAHGGYRREERYPWYLNGDNGRYPNRAAFLSYSGFKYVKVVAYDKYGKKYFEEEYTLDAYCPRGHYEWRGECKYWSYGHRY